MTFRKVVSLLVGGIQCALGGVATVLTYLVFASRPLQEMLAIEPSEVPLFMFVLSVFSLLSIMSGLLLVWGRNGRF